MKKFLSIVLAALLCVGCMLSTASCGDSGKYKVGILQLVDHVALDAATKGFKDALIEELGEENIEFLEKNAQNDTNACTTIANDFVTKNVDLIMANATPALQAAANATEKIPVLGTSVTEYGVALDIKNFDGLVGGNVSGTSDLAPLDKQVEMIRELYPDAKKIGMLYCSAEPNSDYQVKEVTKLIKKAYNDIVVTNYPFSDSNDVAAVSAKAAADSDVIYIPTDNTAASCTESINGAIGKTPVIAGESGICSGCGVATLSIDYYDLGVTTGKMAAKILKGESKIEEMKIEYADASTKKYNKVKCDELDIDTKALEEKGYVAIEAAK